MKDSDSSQRYDNVEENAVIGYTYYILDRTILTGAKCGGMRFI